ncbi:MAG: hypothetical protein AB7I04_05615 [Pseudomonadales bacterium]
MFDLEIDWSKPQSITRQMIPKLGAEISSDSIHMDHRFHWHGNYHLEHRLYFELGSQPILLLGLSLLSLWLHENDSVVIHLQEGDPEDETTPVRELRIRNWSGADDRLPKSNGYSFKPHSDPELVASWINESLRASDNKPAFYLLLPDDQQFSRDLEQWGKRNILEIQTSDTDALLLARMFIDLATCPGFDHISISSFYSPLLAPGSVELDLYRIDVL